MHPDASAAQLDRERIARVEAEAASHAKSEFLAMMSHELRTPLNAVIGYCQLLDVGIAGPITAEQRAHIDRIRSSGSHLLGLVNDVLDLSRIDTGRLPLTPAPTLASRTIGEAVAMMQPLADLRGVVVAVKDDERGATYDGDESRVRRILLSLLDNAVKFTPAGGHITVATHVHHRPVHTAELTGDGPWVAIDVEDTGVGIPDDQCAAIWRPFVQAYAGRTRPTDGSGLGLTISRGLARLMNGDLTVHSEVGKGSCFTLWLRAAASIDVDDARWIDEQSPAQRRDLAVVGEALLRDLQPLIDHFVSRVREERIVTAAEALSFAHLADHVGTFVADVAGVLIALDELRAYPSAVLADGLEIQRLVAERHGVQRARLGWSAAALHREWAVLREEIDATIVRRVRAVPHAALADARVIIGRFVDQAETASGRALARITSLS